MDLVETQERPEIEHKAKVLICGYFKPEEIDVFQAPSTFQTNAQTEANIEREWGPKLAKGWFAGPLSRLESYTLTPDGKLQIGVSNTTFDKYVGTRDLQTVRTHGIEFTANPIGVSAALVTVDGKLIIGHKVQGDAAGSIDAVGGYVHPQKDINPETGKLDLVLATKREIEEETGVKGDEITGIGCLGIAQEYAGLFHPVIPFTVSTSLRAEDIVKRTNDGEVRVMVIDPFKIPNSPNEDLISAMKIRYPQVEPDGQITLALASKYLKGVEYPKQILRTPDKI